MCQSILCYSICAQQNFYYLNGQGADLALHFFYLSHHSLDLIMSYSGPEVLSSTDITLSDQTCFTNLSGY